jgi:RNA polymerase sigma-70 factor (ECF subfamily)
MYALATDTFFPALAAGGRPGGKVIALAPGRLRVSLDRGAEGGARLSALVVAIAERGDREAFTLLFNHFAPRVKSYLLRMGATAETAEELAQETLLTVWRRAGAFDPGRAAASTWIFTIARNLRIDVARRERRPLPGEDIAEPCAAPVQPDAGVVALQDEDRIAAAIATLPLEQSEVVRLAFFSDKPHSEIANDLALPLGTVKSRLRLAMAKLRTLLEEAR